MNQNDREKFGLIALALGILVGLGMLLRWACTSVVGFIVVAILVIMLWSSGRGECSYSRDFGYCRGYYH
jgi:uncharacterized membrane protein YphA (DoxX/SURF4 family)